ncbi:MAG TPA: hypothetical protein P5531_00315 [Bacteroidales bacterium]|nr:hypothetical protein [Bacteroidales bacterium]HSA42105.1 hypothetical protein [Bacteroidales bacterium]
MKKSLFTGMLICLIITFSLPAQDIIILQNGDEINAKVTEIGIDEIRYKRASNPDGPTIVIAKSDVFMIKYKNGSKDVFEIKKAQQPAPPPVPQQTAAVQASPSGSSEPAVIYFIRPSKYTLWAAKFLVRTGAENTTVATLTNGSYQKVVINEIKDHTFTGDLSKWVQGLKQQLSLTVEKGKTYYVKCGAREGFPRPKMIFEQVAEEEGLGMLEKLK